MAGQTVNYETPLPAWAETAYNTVSEAFPNTPPEFRESMALALMAAKYVELTDAQVIAGINAVYAAGLPEIV